MALKPVKILILPSQAILALRPLYSSQNKGFCKLYLPRPKTFYNSTFFIPLYPYPIISYDHLLLTLPLLLTLSQSLWLSFARLSTFCYVSPAEKVIILGCDDLPLTEQDKTDFSQAIDCMVKERNKVFTAWLKKGRLDVDPCDFAKILISGTSTHRAKPQINCSESFQEADASPYASNTVLSQTSQDPSGRYYKAPASRRHEFQQVAEPNIGARRGIATPESTSIAKGMAVNETLVLETRIRYGSVSMKEDDLHFIYPDWKVPEYLRKSLRRDYWATPNAKLYVISDEKGELRFLVDVDLTNRAFGEIRRKLKK